MENKRKTKKLVIVFAIFYLFIGLGDLISGAHPGSRFYVFDDFLLRFIGIIFITSCIGLFFKKEIARKGILLALVLSILEVFIGVPQNVIDLIIIVGYIIAFLIFVPGIFYFYSLRNKDYFN
ncbi:MAG: hypothetical protein AB6733_06315 [Clostridiaceae bacterium]